MKIGITINDVLRDFSSQLKYICDKYNNSAIDSSTMTKINFMYDELKSNKDINKEELINFEALCMELREMDSKLGEFEEPDTIYMNLFSHLENKYFDLIEKDSLVSDYENFYAEYGFKNKEEMNRFLYLDHPLEVFGHADITIKNVMLHFNNFIADLDTDEHELILLSREAGGSIPATFFFLSKTLCKANNIKFVTKFESKWDYVDVLITANPRALNSKPDNKISVKVETSYNTECVADYTINKISDFLLSEELQDEILNN